MEIIESEILSTTLTQQFIGPFDGRLPGPMRMGIDLDGEMISRVSIENGFAHRGLERLFMEHSWQVCIAFADRIDPEAAIFGELAYCMAVERLANIKVPRRAEKIRILMSELNRISCHLKFVACMARSVHSETAFHYILRDREKILDLYELQTGSRFSPNYLCFGGVGFDVSEGFVEKVLEVRNLLKIRISEYNKLFSRNFGFLNRAKETGVLSLQAIKKFGITGPNARASGQRFDVRSSWPYSDYAAFDFSGYEQSDFVGGDIYDRYRIRLLEMNQSLELIKQVSESVTDGDIISSDYKPKMSLPSGEAYACVESPRGLLGCSVVSDGGQIPVRVQFNTPSSHVLEGLPEVLRGERIEDLAVVLASLDICVAEVDH